MGSTNYVETFIRVAEDCPVDLGEQPPQTGKAPSIAALQYALIADHPYQFTSDDILFEVHATRQAIPVEARPAAREAFFAKPQACLRASPLGKRYGWGLHHNAQGLVSLVAVDSEEYRKLSEDPALQQLNAMRSRRA